jgi:hypothetical protein
MRKMILSAAGASLIAAATLMPTIASADSYRYHRDYDRGPGFSINIGPGYRHHRWDDRYAYDYGRYHRHHDHDWDRD